MKCITGTRGVLVQKGKALQELGGCLDSFFFSVVCSVSWFRVFRRLNCTRRASRGPPGAMLGSLRVVLGHSWLSRSCLGSLLGTVQGASWEATRPCSSLGAVLGASWGGLEPIWVDQMSRSHATTRTTFRTLCCCGQYC